MIAREILIRTSPLRAGKWLFFLVTCTCLAISAFYELIEWWVAMVTGTAADAFLGTQGDVWDTQWDMNWALLGDIVAQIFLQKIQDSHLKKISQKNKPYYSPYASSRPWVNFHCTVLEKSS
jgi:putative membrane protein